MLINLELDARAQAFKALGDSTRLRIFEFLRNCSPEMAVEESGDIRAVTGPTVGDICCHLNGGEKVTSTISFHLKELRQAGLISVERRGKHMICSINQNALSFLSEYFSQKNTNETDCECE